MLTLPEGHYQVATFPSEGTDVLQMLVSLNVLYDWPYQFTSGINEMYFLSWLRALR